MNIYNTSKLVQFLEQTNDYALRWKGNTNDSALTLQPNIKFESIKPILRSNISLAKHYRFRNHRIRKKLFQEAQSLKEIIENYLKN